MGEDKFLAASLYRQAGGNSFKECLEKVRTMTPKQKRGLIEVALGTMGDHDRPPRELELTQLTFDIKIDWAGYYDFKRNRMQTTIVQDSGWSNGAILPAITAQAGVAEEMQAATSFARDVALEIRPDLGVEAKYLETNASMQRLLVQMNIRQAYEFFRNRASTKANPGYRYSALLMGELVKKVYPNLWKFLGDKFGYPPASEVGEAFFGLDDPSKG
jgi:hypothetical protein